MILVRHVTPAGSGFLAEGSEGAEIRPAIREATLLCARAELEVPVDNWRYTLADWGGTCGNVCGYCQGGTSCNSLGNMNFDGGGDSNFPQLAVTVHWLCTN